MDQGDHDTGEGDQKKDGDVAGDEGTATSGGGDDDKDPDDDDGKDTWNDATCGNDIKEYTEACDGSDLGGLTCVDLGFYGGDLGCVDCQLDATNCTDVPPDIDPPVCGDGVKNPGEGCDPPDFGRLHCKDFGYFSGDLQCTATCQLDFSGCNDEDDSDKGENCGNGQLDPGETCEGDTGGLTCQSLGFKSGELTCDPDFCYLNTSKCE